MRRARRYLQLAWFLVAMPILSLPLFRLDGTELAAQGSMRLRVDLSERRLYVIEGGKVVKSYPVAVGRRSHPTPTGRFRTGRIVWNPGWVPPNSRWARGMRPRAPGDPRNPMQGVKIYFREPAYYIHGTNDPASIGRAVSHGCIRMTPGDARALARRIQRHGGSVPLVIHR
jgi:L,D-transpeptidase ErfK/SrfK